MPDDLSPQILQGIISIWAAEKEKREDAVRIFHCHQSPRNTSSTGCMLQHETAPSFKHITSLPPSAAACLEEAILTLNRKPSKSTENVMSARDLETNAIVIKRHCSPQSLWAALSGQTQLFTTWLDLSTTGISVQSCLFNFTVQFYHHESQSPRGLALTQREDGNKKAWVFVEEKQ